ALLTRISAWRAGLIALLSILLHDLCDLLQNTDRTPFWPVWNQPVALGRGIIPHDVLGEAILFAGLFAAFLLIRFVIVRRVEQPQGDRAAATPVIWLGRALTLAILLLAVGTHLLRGIRERDLRRAYDALHRGDYAAAIALADSVRPWPGAARPGEIDCLR